MKTKILATFGPAIEEKSKLAKIIKYTDIIRINFSHTNEEQAEQYIAHIKAAEKLAGKEISLLADLPGPKIRLGKIKDPIIVKKGDLLKLFYEGNKLEKGVIPVSYRYISDDCRNGMHLSIGDGYLKMKVEGIKDGIVFAKAINDGIISSRKGLNLIGADITEQTPTEEDIKFAKFAKDKFDFIALSFVKSDEDIKRLREKVGNDIFVISKIERRHALDNIKAIAEESDGIMVARGDLAFDIPVESIPIAQKKIIKASREAGKPVIVATQMLMSMVNNPMPTRAEVNDVANSVFEDADCVMLSDETAVGSYPIESIETMSRVIHNAEKEAQQSYPRSVDGIYSYIAHAAKDLSEKHDIKCIFVPTESGASAIRLSQFRPSSDIIALSENPNVRSKLALFKGVRAMDIKNYSSTDEMLENIKELALKLKIYEYLVVYGSPRKKGSTDSLKYVSLLP
ncbi:pyruvate kinase [Candidatus Mancarchaeum acidiphilum]|uniref:Pyruvate kinase n=1 Tax=Candidatus Mancarchaeum acidiphilum TaxID=1920749 RepID=A0A218NMF5_9ARCH|nr:pyruvate kinase [Candidatus Mancarchaeum acidiphilum]ASI13652.1 pyruvate kinase [Candidatus Mancarchaeum acidiphilum]